MRRTIRQLIEAGYIKPKAARTPPRPDFKTHCKHGHPREPWNIYTYANGKRECLACRKLWQTEKTPKHWAEWGLA